VLNHKLTENVYIEKNLLGGLVDHNFADKFYRINIYIETANIQLGTQTSL